MSSAGFMRRLGQRVLRWRTSWFRRASVGFALAFAVCLASVDLFNSGTRIAVSQDQVQSQEQTQVEARSVPDGDLSTEPTDVEARMFTSATRFPRVELREILVPADRPESWPDGDWQPMSRREFLSHWQLIKPREQTPGMQWIARAEYSAAFVDRNLQLGTGKWVIHRHGSSPGRVELDELELPVSNLLLNGVRSNWRNSRDGTPMIFTSSNPTTATFDWNLRGERRRYSTLFPIRVPSASSSTLTLNLPEHARLESSAGVVRGPLEANDAGRKTWIVDLGQAASCLLTVLELPSQIDTRSTTLIQQETSYVVRQEGVDVQADLNVIVEGKPIGRLEIPLPEGVDIFSVLYGNDGSLPWTVSRDDQTGGEVITLEFTDSLNGILRPIRLNGFAETKVNQDWSLPLFRVPGVVTQALVRLSIESPLQLKRIEPTGCRIINALSGASSGSTYQLHQDLPDAALNIRVGFPAVAVAARVLNHLQFESPGWRWTAEIDLLSQSGTAYQAQFIMPPRWDVIEVQLAEKNLQQGQILQWGVESTGDERQMLVIDVARAIDPEHPLSVTIRSRQTPGMVEDRLVLPTLAPARIQLDESIYAVSTPGEDMPHIQLDKGMQSISRQSIESRWSNSTLFQSLSESGDSSLWFLSTSTSQESYLEFPRFRQGFRGRATVEYDLFSNHLDERFYILAEPVSEPIDRVLVYANGTGPDFEWGQINDRVTRVEAERLPADRHQQWNLPAAGELWEIRLPEPSQEPVQLRAHRTRYHAGQITGQLVFLPQTRDFRGTIELNGTPDLRIQTQTTAQALQTRAGELQTRQNDYPDAINRWEYDDIADRFDMSIAAETTTKRPSPIIGLHLQTRLFADGSGGNRYLASYTIFDHHPIEEFTYRLPPNMRWISTKVNGRAVQPQIRGDEHLVVMIGADVGAQRDKASIEVDYQDAGKSVWLRERRSVIAPTTALPIVQFDWDVDLPEGYEIEAAPRGMTALSAIGHTDWSVRCLGPWGRTKGETWFNPLSFKSWKRIFQDSDVDRENRDRQATYDTGSNWHRLTFQARAVPASPSIVIWNIRRLNWIGYLAFFVTLCGGGLLKYARPRMLHGTAGIIWCALTLMTIWFVDGPLSLLTGGIVLATFCVYLSPLKWFVRRVPVDRSVSNPSTTRQMPIDEGQLPREEVDEPSRLRQSATTLLILLALNWSAWGQVSAPPTGSTNEVARPSTENGQSGETPAVETETWDLLIPFEEQQDEPSLTAAADGDLVYLNADAIRRMRLYADMHAARKLDYVIHSAEYATEWDADDRLKLSAVYRLSVLADGKSHVVRLPLANVHPSREATCLVDGNPHRLLSSPDRSGFMIELESSTKEPPSPPLPENIADEPSPLNDSSDVGEVDQIRGFDHRETSWQTHEIALSLYPHVKTFEGRSSFEIRVPAVSDSRLTMRFPRLPHEIEVLGDKPLGLSTLDDLVLKTELGRQSLISAGWSWEPTERNKTALSATQQTLLDFSPRFVRGRSIVRYQMQGDKLNRIHWRLPAEVIVRQVTSDREMSYNILDVESESRKLLVEFEQYQDRDFQLDVEWLMPIKIGDDSQIEIPPLDWTAHQYDLELDISLPEIQVGVSSLPGYTVAATPDDKTAPRAISPDEFMAQWAKGDVYRRPSLAAVYDSHQPLAYVLKPLDVVIKARADETLHVTNQIVNWSATIEVDASRSPVILHELRLDPDVRLDAISIIQDDAERLAYYTREGDRLMLFLKDLTIGTQNISLRGTLPLVTDRERPIPQFAYLGQNVTQSTLTIRRDDMVDVELTPEEHWTPMTDEPDIEPEGASWKTMGRFLHRVDGQYFKTTRRSLDAPRVSRVAAVKLESGRSWKLRLINHIEQIRQAPMPLHLTIPTELSNVTFPAPSSWETREEESNADGRIVHLSPLDPDHVEDVIVIEGEWSMNGEEPWTIPMPYIIGAQIERQMLLISPRDSYQPGGGMERRLPADLPPWSRSGIEEFIAVGDARLYAKADGAWTLVPAIQQDQNKRLTVDWMRTECRLTVASGGWEGRTLISVESAPGRVLRIDWPGNTTADVVWLNGTALAVSPLETGEMSIPLGALNSSSSHHIVQIFWRQGVTSTWKVIQGASLNLPRIHGENQPKHYVEIIDSNRYRRLSLTGIALRGELDYHLEQADNYAADIRLLDESHPGLQLLRRDLSREMQLLKSEFARQPLEKSTEDLRQRWEKLSRSVGESVSNADVEADPTWVSAEILDRENSDRVHMIVGDRIINASPTDSESRSADVRLWWIDNRWFTAIVVTISLLFAWYILRIVFDWSAPRLAYMHELAFLLTVSLIWWLWMQASPVGFVLLLGTAWVGIRRWRFARRLAPSR